MHDHDPATPDPSTVLALAAGVVAEAGERVAKQTAAHADLDDRFRLEWWNGVYWETTTRHARLTWAEWVRMRPIVERDWTAPWRLVGEYLKSASASPTPASGGRSGADGGEQQP